MQKAGGPVQPRKDMAKPKPPSKPLQLTNPSCFADEIELNYIIDLAYLANSVRWQVKRVFMTVILRIRIRNLTCVPDETLRGGSTLYPSLCRFPTQSNSPSRTTTQPKTTQHNAHKTTIRRMLSAMKLTLAAVGLLASTADAHAHLTRVVTSSGQTASGSGHQPQSKDKIRQGIARNSGSGIPGVPSGFNCDWCVLESTNRNPQRYSQWWSANPGAHTTNANTWPVYPCMSYDSYGARGVLNVRPGENMTTSTFVNADHGGNMQPILTPPTPNLQPLGSKR
jgi:hypothetical protein